MTTNLFVIFNIKQLWTGGSFRISLPFFRTSWGAGVLNSAIFKLIRMLEWNTKHFRLNLQSGLTLSNFRDGGGGFELRNQISHCKTVCIKRNLYLINHNCMRKQWTTKGNGDAGSSCSSDRGLRRYLRNFGGVWTPQPPLSVRHCSEEMNTLPSANWKFSITKLLVRCAFRDKLFVSGCSLDHLKVRCNVTCTTIMVRTFVNSWIYVETLPVV